MNRFACVLALGVGVLAVALVRAEPVPLDQLPKAVTEAVAKRFPKVEMTGASKGKDGETVTFEVSLKKDGKKIDVSVTAAGAITLFEQEFAFKDLPPAVAKTFTEKYPAARYEIIEAVTKVAGGKETLEYYEAVLVAGGKKWEVEVLPDGAFKGATEVKAAPQAAAGWLDDFAAEKADLASVGRNPYFILEPGYQHVYEGGGEKLVISVLTETKVVDGVECRVVEERETKAGKLVEVSRNYFAINKKSNAVYYFGEEVDMYKDGKVTSHDGSWLAGKDGAKFGLMIPRAPKVGMKYYQEVAPKAAMDRAEVVSLTETVKTPAGEFKDCLKTEETTPLEPGVKEYKYYARGVGLVRDGDLVLVRHGVAADPK